jgi:hypothetical protein
MNKHRRRSPDPIPTQHLDLDAELDNAHAELLSAQAEARLVHQQRAEFQPVAERVSEGLRANRFGLLMARAIAARRTA